YALPILFQDEHLDVLFSHSEPRRVVLCSGEVTTYSRQLLLFFSFHVKNEEVSVSRDVLSSRTAFLPGSPVPGRTVTNIVDDVQNPLWATPVLWFGDLRPGGLLLDDPYARPVDLLHGIAEEAEAKSATLAAFDAGECLHHACSGCLALVDQDVGEGLGRDHGEVGVTLDEVGEHRHDVAVAENPLTVVLSGPIANADARLVQLLQSFRQLGDGMLVLHTRGITGAWFGIVREFLLHQSFNTALGPLSLFHREGAGHSPVPVSPTPF